MKRIVFGLLLVFLLAGCDSTFKCTKGDTTLKYTYNEEELVSVTRDGEDIGSIEFAVIDTTYKLVGPEKFEENITDLNEALGFTCK